MAKKDSLLKARLEQGEDLKKYHVRLNRAIGQLGGIKKMIDNGRSSMDILVQISSAQASLRALQYLILSQYVELTLREDLINNNPKATEKLVDIIRNLKI